MKNTTHNPAAVALNKSAVKSVDDNGGTVGDFEGAMLLLAMDHEPDGAVSRLAKEHGLIDSLGIATDKGLTMKREGKMAALIVGAKAILPAIQEAAK